MLLLTTCNDGFDPLDSVLRNKDRRGRDAGLIVDQHLRDCRTARLEIALAMISITGVRTPSLVWNVLRFDHLRRSLDSEGRQNYSGDSGIEPEIKSIVGREPVGFLSNVCSNALIDKLNFVLCPVVQRYAVLRLHPFQHSQLLAVASRDCPREIPHGSDVPFS